MGLVDNPARPEEADLSPKIYTLNKAKAQCSGSGQEVKAMTNSKGTIGSTEMVGPFFALMVRRFAYEPRGGYVVGVLDW
jgi:hypothetical protein